MDIVRSKKTKPFRYYKHIAAIVIFVCFTVYVQQSYTSGEFSMKKTDVIIAAVKQGDFIVKVRAPGVLKPRDIRWISSSVSGRAEQVWVKPGAAVKVGDLLFELSNPELMRSLEESRWELEAQEAETQAENINLEANLLDQKGNILNAKLDFETIDMQLQAEKKLVDQGTQMISTLVHEQTKLSHQQMHQRWKMEQVRYNKMEEQIVAQKVALAARLNKMRKILQSINEQAKNLKITASIDSIVQEVAIELGQQVSVGNNLAKLAKQKDLIAELQIPEMLIKGVSLGQKVMIDTRNNTIEGKVIRIAPAVYNNTVHVDVMLTSELPDDARPDLSIDAEIIISEINNSLFVQRPSYAQSNQKLSLFKINDKGNIATRTTVILGESSVRQIAIKEGLTLGEKIIVSQHDELNRFDTIILN
jgi:multidrug resistance efflux pump